MTPEAPPRSHSPCVSVCRMNPHSGLCEGCWRTLDEIAAWSLLDPEEREAVWRQLDRRRAQAHLPRDSDSYSDSDSVATAPRPDAAA